MFGWFRVFQNHSIEEYALGLVRGFSFSVKRRKSENIDSSKAVWYHIQRVFDKTSKKNIFKMESWIWKESKHLKLAAYAKALKTVAVANVRLHASLHARQAAA